MLLLGDCGKDRESVEPEGKRRRKVLEEDEKSHIFFVVDQAWYEIDLNDDSSGGARRLKNQPPPPFLIGTVLGSCGSFFYSLGGTTSTHSPSFLRTPLADNYFYNTAKPEEGWFQGPPMLSPRSGHSHQAIGSKIYALGGASVTSDHIFFGWDFPTLAWGEYLDVSLPRDEWEWRPVKTSFSTCGNGILNEDEDVLSLPLFKCGGGGFDPLRHILCCCDTSKSRFLVYDVVEGSLCRVFEECHYAFNRLSWEGNVFVEGGCIVSPDSTRVLVTGTFGHGGESSPPWFFGGVHGSNHFPPMPRLMDAWFHRDPDSFSLVRIAPNKYGALWVPKRCGEKQPPFVNLSVFTIKFPSPSGDRGCLDNLDELLRWGTLCVDDVQATFDADRAVPIPLPDYEIDGLFFLKAAVAL